MPPLGAWAWDAEREGFEPPDLLQSTVFKTAAFDRSAISPPKRTAKVSSIFKKQKKILNSLQSLGFISYICLKYTHPNEVFFCFTCLFVVDHRDT